jgi:outer membrane protein TolC
MFMKKSLILLLISFGTFGQSDVLNNYVQEGLKNSQTLKQQNFQLQKAVFALSEAKTLFKPNINFNTTLSTAQGGRKIEIPVGDLVNPVYTTLNALTQTRILVCPLRKIGNDGGKNLLRKSV